MTPNDGGPAFPRPASEYTAANGVDKTAAAHSGMTLRAYIAAAVAGDVYSNTENVATYDESIEATARISVAIADAVIARLAK